MPPSRFELPAMRAFAAIAGALPWGAGQGRFAHRYAASGRWPEGSNAVQRMRSGATVSLDLGDRMQAIAFLLRDYSPEIADYISGRLPQDGTLFDVGANVGLVSFSVAARRPDVTVHAFEPNPRNADAWRRNQRLNDATAAKLIEAGASDREGEAGFAVPRDSGSGMIQETGRVKVSITTLDRYCERNGVQHIDVLKIDVQGHEPAVLRGAAGLLDADAIRTIVCEISDVQLRGSGADRSAILDPLEGNGFRLVRLPESGLRRLLPGARAPVRDLAFCDVAFER